MINGKQLHLEVLPSKTCFTAFQTQLQYFQGTFLMLEDGPYSNFRVARESPMEDKYEAGQVLDNVS